MKMRFITLFKNRRKYPQREKEPPVRGKEAADRGVFVSEALSAEQGAHRGGYAQSGEAELFQ